MRLHIMDTSGHTTLRSTDEVNGTMSVAELEQAFHQKKVLGYMAYTEKGNGEGEVINHFDPNEREIIMALPLQGG